MEVTAQLPARPKIYFDSYLPSWIVECGPYYGVQTAETLQQPAWVVEMAGSKANAERIKRNADLITEYVKTLHSKHIRLHVTFLGDAMVLMNYDNDQFLTELPARP